MKNTFQKATPADFSSFRQAVNGGELPNARLVSLAVDIKPPTASAPFSLLLETFGRLLFQDLVNTPQVVGAELNVLNSILRSVSMPISHQFKASYPQP